MRGLCPDSMYNSAYTLTMTGAGRPRYLGHYTSSIQFDRDTQLWRWLDMKLNTSVATRPAHNLSWTLRKICHLICFSQLTP